LISTVTTVTTTTTTTAAATASTVTTATSLMAGLGLIATVALIVLLITKELAGAAAEGSSAPEFTFSEALNRVLSVGIVPLLMVFVSIVFVKVINVL